MIDHVWSVLCTKAVIDKDTNLITLVDAVEELTVEVSVLKITPGGTEGLPAAEVPAEVWSTLPVNIEIVSLWLRRNPDEPERAAARIMLEKPNAEPHDFGKVFDVDLSGEFKRLRTRVRISGFPAKESGRYIMSVQLQQAGQSEWDEVARLPLDIVLNLQKEP